MMVTLPFIGVPYSGFELTLSTTKMGAWVYFAAAGRREVPYTFVN
jgi:hypothetical protein